jgi:hypothetical protein
MYLQRRGNEELNHRVIHKAAEDVARKKRRCTNAITTFNAGMKHGKDAPERRMKRARDASVVTQRWRNNIPRYPACATVSFPR